MRFGAGDWVDVVDVVDVVDLMESRSPLRPQSPSDLTKPPTKPPANPSGPATEHTRIPHGVSPARVERDARSLIRLAMASMFCSVVNCSESPSPLARSHPLTRRPE